jgi:peptidyl-prolyl cis-trans isomerase B (cyclophilin B)
LYGINKRPFMNIKYLYFAIFVLLVLGSCNRPVAKFIIEKKGELNAPAKVEFVNQSQKADKYYWDFGDGDTSNVENPEHNFIMSGNYTIELTAKKDKKANSTKQKLHIKPPVKCLVLIQTPYGDMIAELYDNTPKHRDNFTKLVDESFYNGLLFHRVINGFMIQGGDPDSKNAAKGKRLGAGGPGYQIDAEIIPENIHIKGALAAARMGDAVNPEKRSSGSQFYIVQGNKLTENQLQQIENRKGIHYTDEQKKLYMKIGGTPFLDNDYTVFGRVIEGLDVIDKIAKAKTDRGNRPVEDIWMKIYVIK